MTMRKDPIVAEVHRVRQAIMAEFNHDLEAYFRYIQSVERHKRERGVRYMEGPLRGAAEPNAA
jgi:hypothetical protein